MRRLRNAWARWKERIQDYFVVKDGGKNLLILKRVGISSGGLFMVVAGFATWISGGSEDRTFYNSQSGSLVSKDGASPTGSEAMTAKEVQRLLNSGSQQLAEQKRRETLGRKRVASVKYYASQLVGQNSKAPKAIQTGARLLGFLITSIDTREPSLVSVVLPHGGVSDSGVEIPKGAVLMGSFSYRGGGNKVAISFSRMDTPDGDRVSIAAVGLDVADYTAGVRGEIHSDESLKVASSLGLSMAASMTDVLTERESLGSFGSAEAKPTMSNALLQGVSNVAKEQSGRISDQINGTEDYVFIPKGKEVIVQLTEDYKP